MRKFLLAAGFLTVLPFQLKDKPEAGDLGRSASWFPLVGMLIGLLLAGLNFGLLRLFPTLLAGALVVAAWAGLTGSLHLDGLADCCDGLFSAAAPARRLEIMRDPRLGSFGGVGLVLFLVLKVLAVGLMSPSLASTLALILAPALARWWILPMVLLPAARPGGMGAEMALGMQRETFIWAALIPAVLIFFTGTRGLVSLLLVALTVWGISRLVRSRLGGMTGDVLGLTVEISELVVLLVFAARFQLF